MGRGCWVAFGEEEEACSSWVEPGSESGGPNDPHGSAEVGDKGGEPLFFLSLGSFLQQPKPLALSQTVNPNRCSYYHRPPLSVAGSMRHHHRKVALVVLYSLVEALFSDGYTKPTKISLKIRLNALASSWRNSATISRCSLNMSKYET
ncbi:hypothetical protein V6N11_073745 [Hibiscus sabdariffa]|uniref:Uncharacterized protein n=2 Tax=Hibiscus sabdariffa TaxID=183260 RepID=A0ABR2G3S5_9ROSI